jgi:DNA-binding NarL/FixJ family response regulator
VTDAAAFDADATATGEISVLIVDDQRLVRAGFSVILGTEPGITVVGEAGNGEEAVALARRLAPTVVLMDIRMPVMDGLAAARTILVETSCRVIMLTTFDTDEYVYAALRAGASGFLLKDVPPAELTQAIRTVAHGDAVVSPRITRRLLEEYAHQLPDLSAATAGDDGVPVALRDLTDRELEVLRAVADGLSNAEIAERLFVSEATVKSHVGRMLAKLGLRDRVQAVVLAFQTGLVSPTR